MYVLMDNDEWKQTAQCHKWSPLHYRVRFKNEGPWEIFPNEMVREKPPEERKDEKREYFGPVKIKAGKFQLDGIVIGHDGDRYVVQKENGNVKAYSKGRLIFVDPEAPAPPEPEASEPQAAVASEAPEENA